MKHPIPAILIAIAALSLLTQAQNAPAVPTAFEVASIKPSPPPTAGNPLLQQRAAMARSTGGPGTNDPEHMVFSQMPLRMLLYRAYEVHPDQITGPDWLDTEEFDVNAKVPPGATQAQAMVMLRNLLLERFKITLHSTAARDDKAWELIAAKNGPKLKEVESNPNATGPTPEERFQVELDTDGFPVIPEGRIGIRGTRSNDLNRVTCRACSVGDLVRMLAVDLAVPVGSPVIALAAGRIADNTGLTGKYDFRLEYSAGPGAGGALQPPPIDQPQSGPGLFAALEQQLGLKLQRATVMHDVLVIDRIERVPTEN